jgi:hypothetical protein
MKLNFRAKEASVGKELYFCPEGHLGKFRKIQYCFQLVVGAYAPKLRMIGTKRSGQHRDHFGASILRMSKYHTLLPMAADTLEATQTPEEG